MKNAGIKPLSLESFLKQSYIDESLAWEYVNGAILKESNLTMIDNLVGYGMDESLLVFRQNQPRA